MKLSSSKQKSSGLYGLILSFSVQHKNEIRGNIPKRILRLYITFINSLYI